MMDTTTTVAIIAGIASLLVATITSVIAFITAKMSARANKELEQVRHELQRITIANSFTVNDINQRRDILGKTCSSLQSLRDDLRAVQTVKGQGREPIKERVSQTAQTIIDLFTNSHFYFPSVDRAVMNELTDLVFPLAYDSSSFDSYVDEELLEYLKVAHQYFIDEYARQSGLLQNLPILLEKVPLWSRYGGR